VRPVRPTGFIKEDDEQAAGWICFQIFESADLAIHYTLSAQASDPSQYLDDVDLCFASPLLWFFTAR